MHISREQVAVRINFGVVTLKGGDISAAQVVVHDFILAEGGGGEEIGTPSTEACGCRWSSRMSQSSTAFAWTQPRTTAVLASDSGLVQAYK